MSSYLKNFILDGVYAHVSTSIKLLANKELNDTNNYRNSIKESISAVESLCYKLNKHKSKGLKDALKLLAFFKSRFTNLLIFNFFNPQLCGFD